MDQSSLAFYNWLFLVPSEFTKVVKQMKLMAQARGIGIHQYLDNWLIRALCQETCLQHTKTPLVLCHSLGWVVNMNKSEEFRNKCSTL